MVTNIIMMAPGRGRCVHIRKYESEEEALRVHWNAAGKYKRYIEGDQVYHLSPAFVSRYCSLFAALYYNVPIVYLED